MKTFYKNSTGYENHMTPQGVVVVFYQGYAQSDEPEVCEYLSKLKGVKEVTGEKNLNVPTPPDRATQSNISVGSLSTSELIVTPGELLQRAVAASTK